MRRIFFIEHRFSYGTATKKFEKRRRFHSARTLTLNTHMHVFSCRSLFEAYVSGSDVSDPLYTSL